MNGWKHMKNEAKHLVEGSILWLGCLQYAASWALMQNALAWGIRQVISAEVTETSKKEKTVLYLLDTRYYVIISGKRKEIFFLVLLQLPVPLCGVLFRGMVSLNRLTASSGWFSRKKGTFRVWLRIGVNYLSTYLSTYLTHSFISWKCFTTFWSHNVSWH